MQFMPDELHLAILTHFTNRTDLANYRLISKDCARIGADPYFERFPYGHNTLQSTLARARTLAASPFVKHIKHLDYDERGWLRSAKKRHKRCNLAKEVIQIFWEAGAQIENLHAQGVYNLFFLRPVYNFAQSCAHLKHLTIRCAYYQGCSMYERKHILQSEEHMREFFTSLKGLEVLSADCIREGGDRGRRNLLNTFSMSHTWPNLRELHLSYFFAETQDLIAILRNHANRLRCVRFTYMLLIPIAQGGGRGEWFKLFEQLGSMKLHHGSIFNGHEQKGEEFEWVMYGQDGTEVVVKTDVKHFLEDSEANVKKRWEGERLHLHL